MAFPKVLSANCYVPLSLPFIVKRRINLTRRIVDQLFIREIPLQIPVICKQQAGSADLGQSHSVRIIGATQAGIFKLFRSIVHLAIVVETDQSCKNRLL